MLATLILIKVAVSSTNVQQSREFIRDFVICMLKILHSFYAKIVYNIYVITQYLVHQKAVQKSLKKFLKKLKKSVDKPYLMW